MISYAIPIQDEHCSLVQICLQHILGDALIFIHTAPCDPKASAGFALANAVETALTAFGSTDADIGCQLPFFSVNIWGRQ